MMFGDQSTYSSLRAELDFAKNLGDTPQAPKKAER